jgi:serine/threonine-protein kinase RsbW
MSMADFEQRLGSDLGEIALLSAAFCEWGLQASLTERQIFQVNLVLEELATNVIVHGLGPGRPGWLRVHIVHCRDHLLIEVRDSAPPFDPFGAAPPELESDIDGRRVGGLGVYFVRTLADAWSYVREDEQNVVTLHKRLGTRP